MSIVQQGTVSAAAASAPPQHRGCDTANHPSSTDIERMLRADRTRAGHFRFVAASLAASWREAAP